MSRKALYITAVLMLAGITGCSTTYKSTGESPTAPSAAVSTSEASGPAKTVQQANAVLTSIAQTQQIPADVIRNAAGIAIIPSVFKAGFIVGGQHGTGVLLEQNNGQWSPPVFVSISGGSFGAQIGAQSSDLLMIFKTKNSFQPLVQGNSFTLSADASAAGPTGSTSAGETKNAEVLTYQRTSGLFAGVSLAGSTLSFDRDETLAYYEPTQPNVRGYFPAGQSVAQGILEPGNAQQNIMNNVPPSAEQLIQELNRLSR